MTQNTENTNSSNKITMTFVSGFQTPAIRQRMSVVTPPETPSKKNHMPTADASSRKRQRTAKACDDERLFLPVLSDFDSPVRFPRQRRSNTSHIIQDNNERFPVSPLPVLPSRPQYEEEDDSPVVVSLAPRFQWERIVDLSSEASSSNKRFKLTPTTPKSIFLPLDL
mmetsp:Transcript_12225/g.29130  ORF Transcript_12225/g.29130 Transcript_12225/m.29130 type:complete len:167 (+) Transcript_12225:567-1067(+)|eukprot:CAMPEP_0113622784 /NCGR_PEP_ID=MMETSP0017_2-20120614/11694_1 /TAXON_ID=2856 /ORGANISM="Cylindrotheca closterium" /LENGTH=166 /DNA_ID=CAMNT_0000532661 /DNA_START=290 /DNA_END=790 /DNA_ORIENTATION=- /assembly_acc=CAM_ASM_000147